MKYTQSEVLQYVKEEDIKFIRLAFCDVFGRQKNLSILPGELPGAFAQGIPFDGSCRGSCPGPLPRGFPLTAPPLRALGTRPV